MILGMLENAPEVTKLWADGGFAVPKLLSKLEELGLCSLLEIVEKPKEIKGFTSFSAGGSWSSSLRGCRGAGWRPAVSSCGGWNGRHPIVTKQKSRKNCGSCS